MNLINFIVWLSAGAVSGLVCQPDGSGRKEANLVPMSSDITVLMK